MIRDILLVGISSLLSFSAGYLIHKNRLPIAENINYYYVRGTKYLNNLNPIEIIEIIELCSKKLYLINLLKKPFIVTDLNIDIGKYNTLVKSMKIPHTPDDILEANILFNDGTTREITELMEILIGPFLNQVNPLNKEWIIEYLEKKHKLENIDKIEIIFVNNNKIII